LERAGGGWGGAYAEPPDDVGGGWGGAYAEPPDDVGAGRGERVLDGLLPR